MFDFFKKVVTFHPIKRTLNVLEWDISGYGGQFGLAFITFLYVDILDCTGTLYAMARFSGAIDEKTQDFENSSIAFTVDALGISIGSLLGSPPCTAYIESGAGISEGGKTGLTAMFSGLAFFISIFFAPIFASIPVSPFHTLLLTSVSFANLPKAMGNRLYFDHSRQHDG